MEDIFCGNCSVWINFLPKYAHFSERFLQKMDIFLQARRRTSLKLFLEFFCLNFSVLCERTGFFLILENFFAKICPIFCTKMIHFSEFLNRVFWGIFAETFYIIYSTEKYRAYLFKFCR